MRPAKLPHTCHWSDKQQAVDHSLSLIISIILLRQSKRKNSGQDTVDLGSSPAVGTLTDMYYLLATLSMTIVFGVFPSQNFTEYEEFNFH